MIDELFGCDISGTKLFIFFIPSRDKNGKEIKDQQLWIEAAAELFSEAFGGATIMPPASGTWLNPETNELIKEQVVLIHSYASEQDARDQAKIQPLADFLHRMGRETKQGEVGFVLDNIFHRILKFRKS